MTGDDFNKSVGPPKVAGIRLFDEGYLVDPSTYSMTPIEGVPDYFYLMIEREGKLYFRFVRVGCSQFRDLSCVN